MMRKVRSERRVVTLRLRLAGIDIVTIGACLAHVSLSTTQKYTHLAMVDIVSPYDIVHPRA